MNLFHHWLCRSARWRKTIQQRVPWVLSGADLGQSVLELGPGPGLTTDLLRLTVRRVTAIELDPKLAESLNSRLCRSNVEVITGDATAMPFSDAEFSGGVSFTMLHHVPSPELQDKLLREVCRPRAGRSFVGSDSIQRLLMRLIHIGDAMVPVDPDTFAVRLEAAEFKVLEVEKNSDAFRLDGNRRHGCSPRTSGDGDLRRNSHESRHTYTAVSYTHLSDPSGREQQPSSRLFLLSPANTSAIRAQLLLNGDSKFELARRIQRQGAPLGEVFSFISSLYFRGKLAYAEAFSRSSAESPATVVMTASRGLLPPQTIVKLDDLLEMASIPIDPSDARYREPLRHDAAALACTLPAGSKIVLLGSIASGKYLDPLLEIFGADLWFPREFVGRGDLSRGGLMLGCAQAGVELDYVPAQSALRRGPRPPRLTANTPVRLRLHRKAG